VLRQASLLDHEKVFDVLMELLRLEMKDVGTELKTEEAEIGYSFLYGFIFVKA